MHLLVFQLNEQRFALPLDAVERVLHAVEVTALPGAPAIVIGAVNVEGRVLPVLDLRQRCSLPQRQIDPADQFLIARTARHTLALVIDEAHGVIEQEPSAMIGSDQIVSGLEQFQGVAKLDDGLVLIHDLEKFLSLDEERTLVEAIERAG